MSAVESGGLVAALAPASIHTALAAVMAELPAIGKDSNASQQQGGYAYRGIEAITGHAQPLFAKHGVVTVPAVRTIEVKDLVVNGKPWTDTTLVVDYTLVGPDGSTLTATCVGVGRDNADKGANKAMTQAFKYLLLQVLCISDVKDDADGTTVTADAAPKRQTKPAVNADGEPLATKDQAAEFTALCEAENLDKQDRAALVGMHTGKSAWKDVTKSDAALLILELKSDCWETYKDGAGVWHAVPAGTEPFDATGGDDDPPGSLLDERIV